MKSRKGFTLIEVIMTIVILAIAAAAFMAMFGRQFTGSAIPAGQVERQYRLIQQMESITSEYRNRLSNEATPFSLPQFQTYVGTLPYVDNSRTGMMTFTYGTATTRAYLRVTLRDGDQTLMSIFTD
jgi:prepilin-type N-terminal cleavage/methylation domain-containing protein